MTKMRDPRTGCILDVEDSSISRFSSYGYEFVQVEKPEQAQPEQEQVERPKRRTRKKATSEV